MKTSNILNSFEIITDFITRYGFYRCFDDGNFLLPKPIGERLPMEKSKIVDYMVRSALVGNKVIGFFDKLPLFKNENLLRSDCIFVTKSLPERIVTPTIFCRKPDDLMKVFLIAVNISSISRLPIVIVMSNNATNGFANFEKINLSLDRVSPYISNETFDKDFDDNSVKSKIDSIHKVLRESFNNNSSDSLSLSFKHCDLDFFDYLLPFTKPDNFDKLAGSECEIFDSEVKAITSLLENSYQLKLDVKVLPDRQSYSIAEFLCAGCPFVNIFNKNKGKSILYFSDVNCKAVYKAFALRKMDIESYMGLVSNKLNVPTAFIGYASNYKPLYLRALNEKNVILLDDFAIDSLRGYYSIGHPKKFINDTCILYPYSCNSIKKYSKPTISERRCKCSSNNEDYQCVVDTKCPALIKTLGKVRIDVTLCTGCLACKQSCKYGAI